LPPQPPKASRTVFPLQNSAIYTEISSGVTEYQPKNLNKIEKKKKIYQIKLTIKIKLN
jgi:hypothetical protein